MKYQNKRNGEIVTVVETNEKFKTVIVELADGKTKTITSATLKRWYTPIEEEQDEVAGDGTPLAEVGKEIAAQAAEKAKKARKKVKAEKPAEVEEPAPVKVEEIPEKPKKTSKTKSASKAAPKPKKSKKTKSEEPKIDVTPVTDWICGKIEAMGAEVFTPDKAPNVRAFKLNGHMFARLNISRKQVTLCCRSAAVESVNVPVDKQQKHMFDVCFVYTDLKSKGIIAKLLEASYQFQLDKKAGKEVK